MTLAILAKYGQYTQFSAQNIQEVIECTKAKDLLRSYCLIYILCYQGWPQIAGIKGHQTRHSGRFYNILSHSNRVAFALCFETI